MPRLPPILAAVLARGRTPHDVPPVTWPGGWSGGTHDPELGPDDVAYLDGDGRRVTVAEANAIAGATLTAILADGRAIGPGPADPADRWLARYTGGWLLPVPCRTGPLLDFEYQAATRDPGVADACADPACPVHGEAAGAAAGTRQPAALHTLPDETILTIAASPGRWLEAWRHAACGVWIALAGEETEDLDAEQMTAGQLRKLLAEQGRRAPDGTPW